MTALPGNKKNFFLFGTLALFTLLFGAAAYWDDLRPFLNFFWSPAFLISIQVSFVAAFCYLIFKWMSRKTWPRPVFKWIFGLLFLPILILPIFRCYFKVPYVFCRACPAPCPWGLVRTFAFSSFLVLNCFGKFWCSSLCPFGTFQECQSPVLKKKFQLAPWLGVLPYVILFAVAGMYFLTLFGVPWQRFFELGRYAWVTVTVGVAGIILVTSFFIPKFFCRYACPVGTIAELTSSFQKKKA